MKNYYARLVMLACTFLLMHMAKAVDLVPVQDSVKKDTIKKVDSNTPLPLIPERKFSFNTKEASWVSVDISPDGKMLAFDVLGDIYTMPSTGGKATVVTSGLQFDSHPRFSPDGKKLLFTSDKSGSENIWYIDMEKKDTVQVTKDKNQNFPSACWSADGNYIIAARGRLSIKLWMYHKDSGGGIQLITEPEDFKTIDPAVSADGRFIYFSGRMRPWNYNAQLPQYQVGFYDMETGKVDEFTSKYGSAFTPTLSKDGKWMVYGSRYEDQTGLILRNLKTGDEKWLAYPVQRDDQESIATMGVLPGMCFTPDSQALIAFYGGKLYRISLFDAQSTEIPLDVDVNLDLGPRLEFKFPITDDTQANVTQIRDATPSPDGSKLVFTALNRLYIMDFPNGTPRRLTSNNFTEAQPVWSPDGGFIVFTTWTQDGGHLYKVSTAGKNNLQQLTKEPGIYSSPSWSYQGNKIAFMRGTAQAYKNAIGPFAFGAEDEICWIPAEGGNIQVVDKSYGRFNPHFTKKDDRIYLTSYESGLVSIRWDGSDEKSHIKITGITTFGFSDFGKNRVNHCMLPDNLSAMEAQEPSYPNAIYISPSGDKALAEINNDVYVVTIPLIGKTPEVSLEDAQNAAFPSKKLTEIGGEFTSWSGDGKKVHWSLGASHFVYDLDKAQFFEDSVKTAKKEEAKKKLEEKKDEKKEETKKEEEVKEEAKFSAKEYEVKVPFNRDMPKGVALLKGARIITMKGKEIIEQGDILVENNRIKAVGQSGTITVPANAQVIDVTGKTIIPGFVDTHAHMWPNWGIHKNQIWIYAANLAYGVTTTRDPQTATTDVLTYADMVEAGSMYGPRIYSTGPGVGFWAYNLQSYEQTQKVLQQYSKYYNTKTIKMYLTGNRQHRQWIIMASKEQGLMPTTEGGLDWKLNLTQLMDGYPGHEHALPISPIYNDVVKTIADAKMCVTPTLLVSYGGPWAENYFYATEKPYFDKKLQFFTPYEELAEKTRRRAAWFMEEEHVFKKHAGFIKNLVEAGGLSGVGSHGQLQGLGYHWELWAMQSGGMSNHDALRVSSILGAESIGLDKDLGSIEAGKLADLLILNANPLDNIRNSNTIQYVMKNGRLHDGNNLDEIYPIKRKAERFEWADQKPENLPGMKK